jgi:hypothetical protein
VPGESDKYWSEFRRRAVSVSVGITVVSGFLLYLLYRVEPTVDPSTGETSGWPTSWFSLCEAILTTLVAIGLISLLVEVLLRESFGRDLRKFLRLDEAVVGSGLQQIASEEYVNWQETLESASKISALIRDPTIWLNNNLPWILAACQKRATTVIIGLPDKGDDDLLAAIAGTIGVDAGTLAGRIQSAINSTENQWKGQEQFLDSGSTLTIHPYGQVPLYESVVADDHVICMLPHARRHEQGDRQLTITFDQDRTGYPSRWLREAHDGLTDRNADFAGDVSRERRT